MPRRSWRCRRRRTSSTRAAPGSSAATATWGSAALMLGRDQEAIEFLQRSLAMNPEARSHTSVGPIACWRQPIVEPARSTRRGAGCPRRASLWPYSTVRGIYPEELTSPVYAAQIRAYQAGLRLAGLRDHADEDADFGVPADRSLHSENAGYTPVEAPGATTDPHRRTGAAACRGFASGHRYGLEFMGPIDPGRGRAKVLGIGRQLRRRGPGSLASQDGRTDRRGSRPACRCSRLELRAL